MESQDSTFCKSMMPYTCPVLTPQLIQQQQLNFQIVSIFRMSFASISLLFSVATIIIYLILKLYQIPFFKVIMLLCFSDIIYSIQCFIMTYEESNLFDRARCQSQAFLSTWANLSQQGWMLVIAIILFSENQQLKQSFDIFTGKRWIFYLMLGVGIPTLIAIPGFFNIYSPQKFYCWITNPKAQIMCNPLFTEKATYLDYCNVFIIGVTIGIYVYAWSTIIANAIVYIVMVKRIKERIQLRRQRNRMMTQLGNSQNDKSAVATEQNDDGNGEQDSFDKRYRNIAVQSRSKYSAQVYDDNNGYYDDEEDDQEDTDNEQNQRQYKFNRSSSIAKVQANMSYKILRFPIAQIVLWFFPTLNGLIGMFHFQNQSLILILSILHVSSMASAGIVNSIIYGWNQVLKLRLNQCIRYGRQRTIQSMQKQVEPLMRADKQSLQRFKD